MTHRCGHAAVRVHAPITSPPFTMRPLHHARPFPHVPRAPGNSSAVSSMVLIQRRPSLRAYSEPDT